MLLRYDGRMGRILTVIVAIAGALAVGTMAGPPNIVVILADDLGAYELGCYGQKKIRTPNIDQIAERGIRFERAYSGSTVCAPSRAVLLTGKHTGHCAIRGNREIGGWGPEEPEGQWPLPADEVTLAEVLRQAGYYTAAFGKWGLGGPGSEGHPCLQGFDHFYGYLCQRVAHNYYPTHLWRNHDVDVLHGNDYFPAHQRIEAPLDSEDAYYERYAGRDYAPQEMLDEAVRVIDEHAERRSGQPLFIYYASIIPHVALQAPRDLIESYPRDWDDKPYLGDRGYLPCPRPRATYAAMISFLDHEVGTLMERLEAHAMLDNTVVIFTSDNGTTFNGGVDRAFFNSLGDLRGFKTNLYEGGIRAPFIAAGPGIEGGTEGGGRVSDLLVGIQDILPTACEFAGVAAPDHIDGISLVPELTGSRQDQQEHEYLYFEFPEGNQQQAIIFRDGIKAIRTNLRRGNTALEVYDLRSDPGETRDIAPENPDLVAQIERVLRAARVPNPIFPIPVLDEGR